MSTPYEVLVSFYKAYAKKTKEGYLLAKRGNYVVTIEEDKKKKAALWVHDLPDGRVFSFLVTDAKKIEDILEKHDKKLMELVPYFDTQWSKEIQKLLSSTTLFPHPLVSLITNKQQIKKKADNYVKYIEVTLKDYGEYLISVHVYPTQVVVTFYDPLNKTKPVVATIKEPYREGVPYLFKTKPEQLTRLIRQLLTRAKEVIK